MERMRKKKRLKYDLITRNNEINNEIGKIDWSDPKIFTDNKIAEMQLVREKLELVSKLILRSKAKYKTPSFVKSHNKTAEGHRRSKNLLDAENMERDLSYRHYKDKNYTMYSEDNTLVWAFVTILDYPNSRYIKDLYNKPDHENRLSNDQMKKLIADYNEIKIKSKDDAFIKFKEINITHNQRDQMYRFGPLSSAFFSNHEEIKSMYFVSMDRFLITPLIIFKETGCFIIAPALPVKDQKEQREVNMGMHDVIEAFYNKHDQFGDFNRKIRYSTLYELKKKDFQDDREILMFYGNGSGLVFIPKILSNEDIFNKIMFKFPSYEKLNRVDFDAKFDLLDMDNLIIKEPVEMFGADYLKYNLVEAYHEEFEKIIDLYLFKSENGRFCICIEKQNCFYFIDQVI